MEFTTINLPICKKLASALLLTFKYQPSASPWKNPTFIHNLKYMNHEKYKLYSSNSCDKKKILKGREEIPFNNEQYSTQKVDLFNRRVILSILLCHPFDKHSRWTQLFSCSGVIPNVSPTDLLTRLRKKKFSSSNLEIFDFKVWTQESEESLSLSLCLIQSGQQNDVLLRRISLFYFWWLMSNHAEQSKNQAIIFSHSVVLEIIP